MKTFGDFEFDDRRRRLRAGGHPVRLSGQALDLLCLLLERPGELITREEIERRLWPDRTVDFHHSLDVVVSRLRTVLGDKGASPRYIETVPRKGYRFIEPVTARPEARPANEAAPLESPTPSLRGRRDSRSDSGDSLCAHPVRQVCSVSAFAGITNRARPIDRRLLRLT